MKPCQHKPFFYRRQRGVTLLEIILSLFIGLFMLAGILQVFISSKQSYRVQENLGRVQENGRFAMEYLARELRLAGFAGCLSKITPDTMVNTLNTPNDFLFNYLVPVQGFEGNSDGSWSPALNTGQMEDATGAVVAMDTLLSPVAGTDVVSLRYVQGELPVKPPYMPNTSADLHTRENNYLEQFDIVIVSDCEASAVLQISSSNPGTSGSVSHNMGVGVPGNATKDLGKIFKDDAQIYKGIVKTYYIATGSDGRSALWELINSINLNTDDSDTVPDNPRELIAGVENMQVLYGVDDNSDGNADRFVNAANVLDADADNEWIRIVAVRASLLLQTSENNLADNPQQYSYSGTTTTAGDRRLRRVFTATVGLRNRVP